MVCFLSSKMNIILLDTPDWHNMLPLTWTRPLAELRCGILTITEKWNMYCKDAVCSFLTQDYLQSKYPVRVSDDNFFVHGACLPDKLFVGAVCSLRPGQAIFKHGELLSFRTPHPTCDLAYVEEKIEWGHELLVLRHPWDIFLNNAHQIHMDFGQITSQKTSQPIPGTNKVICPENVFVEEGARLSCCVLNASYGKIYIGRNAEIMEGVVVRGPMALCEDAIIKMSAKIYEGTTIGPSCKVGGEVQNSVLFGFSNKAHDGYLGNSVLGEWCNLGANTNNSNLKNNYSKVKVWNYTSQKYINTGLMFCGLIMGDHSKTAIHTMFNTGTVVGVSSNVFGVGFPRKYIPSFSWGDQEYDLQKAWETADRVFARKSKEFNDMEKDIFQAVFERKIQFRCG